jgi:putative flippase GtrA
MNVQPDPHRDRQRSMLICHYQRMPEKLRMLVTAIIGAIIGLITYEIIYALNPLQPRATTSWALSFGIGIARQHALHRYLTFTHHSPYWPSLGRAYLMYSGSATVGTLLNWGLTVGLGVNHRIAWIICLFTTAGISLIFLKRYVFRTKIIPA